MFRLLIGVALLALTRVNAVFDPSTLSANVRNNLYYTYVYEFPYDAVPFDNGTAIASQFRDTETEILDAFSETQTRGPITEADPNLPSINVFPNRIMGSCNEVCGRWVDEHGSPYQCPTDWEFTYHQTSGKARIYLAGFRPEYVYANPAEYEKDLVNRDRSVLAKGDQIPAADDRWYMPFVTYAGIDNTLGSFYPNYWLQWQDTYPQYDYNNPQPIDCYVQAFTGYEDYTPLMVTN
ncbi:unnamed protein product, partial [Symbiodinium sp. KB8]